MYIRCTVEYVRLTADFQIFKNISKNKKYQPVDLQVMRSVYECSCTLLHITVDEVIQKFSHALNIGSLLIFVTRQVKCALSLFLYDVVYLAR